MVSVLNRGDQSMTSLYDYHALFRMHFLSDVTVVEGRKMCCSFLRNHSGQDCSVVARP